MKKTLIVTNIVTFLLLIAVIFYAQMQGANARTAYESKVVELGECQKMAEAAQMEAEEQRAVALEALAASEKSEEE